MTEAAQDALRKGHQWVLPVDADEVWYVAGDPLRPISEFLDGQAPDAHIVTAEMWNHVPTGADEEWPSPFDRIKYRKTQPGALPKVACRLHQSLVIDAGNHFARYAGPSLTVGGLCIRHFSWRSPGQYVRKIRNGIVAYSATRLHPDVGKHWRMWADAYKEYPLRDVASSKTLPPDQALEEHFYTWFYSEHPQARHHADQGSSAGEMRNLHTDQDERGIYCHGEWTTVRRIDGAWICSSCGKEVWRERAQSEVSEGRDGSAGAADPDGLPVHMP